MASSLPGRNKQTNKEPLNKIRNKQPWTFLGYQEEWRFPKDVYTWILRTSVYVKPYGSEDLRWGCWENSGCKSTGFKTERNLHCSCGPILWQGYWKVQAESEKQVQQHQHVWIWYLRSWRWRQRPCGRKDSTQGTGFPLEHPENDKLGFSPSDLSMLYF